jgi:replicative DNA helicase
VDRRPHNPAYSFPAADAGGSRPAGLHNYEAEMALLAAIIASNAVYPKVSGTLKAEHFADALHGRIYAAIGKLVGAGKVANVITLKDQFERDPALADVGGAKYLSKLAGSVVTIINAPDYADAVRELWLRRELVAGAEALLESAADLERSPDEVAAAFIADLTQLSGEGRQTAISKRDVAEGLVASMQRPGECYSTGLPSLDDALGGGLYAGKLYGVAARKKVGKTVLLGTVSHNLDRIGVKHLFIALEMSPAEIEQRNAAREIGINPIAFLRHPTHQLADQVASYACDLSEDTTIYEGAPGASLHDVLRMIGRAIIKHRIKGVVLDYWQLVSGKVKNESEEYHLRLVAQSIADFCRRHGLFCLIAAQVNQEGNTRGGEGLKLACDVYFTLHREKASDGAWLEMEESRYVPYCSVGSEDATGLWLHHNGP